MLDLFIGHGLLPFRSCECGSGINVSIDVKCLGTVMVYFDGDAEKRRRVNQPNCSL
jgi:hypothetical protein